MIQPHLDWLVPILVLVSMIFTLRAVLAPDMRVRLHSVSLAYLSGIGVPLVLIIVASR